MVGPSIFWDQMGPGEFLSGRGIDVLIVKLMGRNKHSRSRSKPLPPPAAVSAP